MDSNDDKMHGKWDETKGKAKQAVGDVTDNEDMRREGKADEAEGKGRQALGKAKDAVSDAAESVKDVFKKDN